MDEGATPRAAPHWTQKPNIRVYSRAEARTPHGGASTDHVGKPNESR